MAPPTVETGALTGLSTHQLSKELDQQRGSRHSDGVVEPQPASAAAVRWLAVGCSKDLSEPPEQLPSWTIGEAFCNAVDDQPHGAMRSVIV